MKFDKNTSISILGMEKTALEKDMRMGSNKYSRINLIIGDAAPKPDIPVELVIDAYCYRIYNSGLFLSKKHAVRWQALIEICLDYTTAESVRKYYKKDLPPSVWKLIPTVCKKQCGEGVYVLPTDIIHSVDSAINISESARVIATLTELRDYLLNVDNKTFLQPKVTDVDIVKERLPHISEAIANPNDIDVSLFKECYNFIDGDVDALLLHLIEEYDGGGKVAKKILVGLKAAYETSSIRQIINNDNA